MQSEAQQSLRKRIFATYCIIATTLLLGLGAIFEVHRTVQFHASNLQHLGLSSTFKEDVRALETITDRDLSRFKELLSLIRVEPETCAGTSNLLLGAVGLGNTQNMCQTNLKYTNQALLAVDLYQNGIMDQPTLIEELETLSTLMQRHSFKLHPYVAQSITILLLATIAFLIAKSATALYIARTSARSVEQQFDDIHRIENQLQTKNKQLELTIREHKKLEEQRKIQAEQERAVQQSMLDPMTSLPNRRLLDKKLTQWSTERRKIAIFQVDIDHIKSFNDNYGPALGDGLIVAIANRLQQIAGDDRYLARIGGDEFMIVIQLEHDPMDQGQLEALAHDMVQAASQPINMRGVKANPTISVGIAQQETDAEFENSYEELQLHADMAVHQVKNDGRNNYAFYNAALHDAVEFEKQMRKEIMDGIYRGEFVAHYHPQYDAKTFKLVGVEALIRWYHPERGCLSPATFLDAAQRIGAIEAIDKLVFKQALSDVATWKEKGINIPRFSVNVSYERLQSEDLIESLKQISFQPGEIVFEIAEPILDREGDIEILDRCRQIKELGIDLEIDDFGSGRASIFHLSKLKPKRLKIDHQLIMKERLDNSEADTLDSIVTIAKAVGIEIIAESVDDDQDAQMLTNMGCQVLQGYYFNAPISADDFLEHMLNEKQAKNRSNHADMVANLRNN